MNPTLETKKSEMDFVRRMKKYINMDKIKNKEELIRELDEALSRVANQPTIKQKDILIDYKGFNKMGEDDYRQLELMEYGGFVDTIKYKWGHLKMLRDEKGRFIGSVPKSKIYYEKEE